jgi:uncharacterized protein YwqG
MPSNLSKEIIMLPTKLDLSVMEDPKLKIRELQAHFKEIAQVPVYKPVVRKGQSDLPVSKYFGLPWLPAGEEWPEINGVKLTFILQLDVASLPEPHKSALGSEGLVQLFYDITGENEWDESAFIRRVLTNGQPSSCKADPTLEEGVEGPSDTQADAFTDDTAEWKPKLIKDWKADVDYPRYEHLEDLTDIDLEEIFDRKEVDASEKLDNCLQGDKLGGWPFWTQGVEYQEDKAGQQMTYVFQLDAGCFFDGRKFPAHAPSLFAGDGTGHISVSPTDPNELKFWWACG